VIADQTGSGGTGAGSLTLNGAGLLYLDAANTFTGGVTLDKGVLELAQSAAAGSGGITFATGADATLEVDNSVFAPNSISGFAAGDAVKFLGDGSATLAAPATGGLIDMSSSGNDEAFLKSGARLGVKINGFGSGDKVDFEAVKYASSDTVAYASGLVTIDNSKGAKVASFDVSGTYTAANFLPADDGSGDLVVSFVVAPAPTAGKAALRETNIGSLADLLGWYHARTAGPPWAPGSDLSTLQSWASLTAGVGADPGGFGFHSENDGTVGGARDAWGVGVGWDGSTGHGPGPSA
jgi:autotransporter-associated beta strand protein